MRPLPLHAAPSLLTLSHTCECDPFLESRKNCYLGAEAQESYSLLQRAHQQFGVFYLEILCQCYIGSNWWKRGSLWKITGGLNTSHRFGCSSSAVVVPLWAQLLPKHAASRWWTTHHGQPRAQLVWHCPPQAEELAEELGDALLPPLGVQPPATMRYPTGCLKFYRVVSSLVRLWQTNPVLLLLCIAF